MIGRRGFLKAGAVAAPALFSPKLFASVLSLRSDALIGRAKQAMAEHRGSLVATDRMVVADFSDPSSAARFHLIDLERGKTQTLLVAHGRGSDPDHSGWLKSFSNVPGSCATSRGAYVSSDQYEGKHGRSLRLKGLDPTNNNAESRGIVVHSAWYVDPAMARKSGMIGRSEGCFAVAQNDLQPVLDFLGKGRMIYADR